MPNKNYIDVLESFKKEEEHRFTEERATISKERQARMLAPAVELFDQLVERYKDLNPGGGFYRESPTSLRFKVPGGFVCAGIHYGCRTSTHSLVWVGLILGFKPMGGAELPFVENVPEDQIHNLFPTLLRGLATMELKHPQWAPAPPEQPTCLQ